MGNFSICCSHSEQIIPPNAHYCFGKNGNVDIDGCAFICRIVTALREYHKHFDKKKNNNKLDIDQLLNDWIHFITTHSNQLHAINQQLFSNHKFNKCIIENCKLSQLLFQRRNYRNNTKSTKLNEYDHDLKETEQLDDKYVFYYDIMNHIHFYLFHLEDLGMRIFESNTSSISNSNQYCYDHAFSTKFNAISKKMHKSDAACIKRLSGKFTINVQNVLSRNICNEYENADEDKVWMYEMFKYLKVTGKILSSEIYILRQYLYEEQYDSDAILYDIDIDNSEIKYESNIIIKMKKDNRYGILIKQFKEETELLSKSFATGLVFYYWPYYQHIPDQLQNKVDNINEYHQLYVQRKYGSFKQEILNSRHITFELYEKQVLLKAQHYIITKRAKLMVTHYKDYLHYDIKRGTPLSLNHLMAVILYTDF
eukprot:247659_1